MKGLSPWSIGKNPPTTLRARQGSRTLKLRARKGSKVVPRFDYAQCEREKLVLV